MLSLLLMTWVADIGGLFFGGLFGKRPFAQSISPKKTVEGIYGAWGLCLTAAVLMYFVRDLWHTYLFDNIWVDLPLLDYFIIGNVVGILAILSDLIESFLKRCGNVKVLTHFDLTWLGLRKCPSRPWRIFWQSGLYSPADSFRLLVHVYIPSEHHDRAEHWLFERDKLLYP